MKKQKGKSLQKLTEIEKLDSPTEVREYLEANPNECSKVIANLESRMTKSYKEKLGNENDVLMMAMECYKFRGQEELGEKVRNVTFEINHSLISQCMHNYILENRTFPTTQFITSHTGLSRTTVYKHFKDGLHHDFSKLVKGKLEYMATSALYTLFYIGVDERNASALKTFIELSGAINKRQSTTVNNYIQINNLKLSTEEFNRLPKETILEVEEIISKSINNPRLN